ncbi:MAG TPA: nicotinate-nucleotide adenylyltransferase [Acidimicrobiia bacterium]|jgi:nicotinate-nucleotide adenylyltransferase
MTHQRIGLFGGTFDPPHNAHIVAALAARRQLALDVVLMVVAGDPWQKRDHVVTNPTIRFDMVRLTCEGLAGLEPSGIEVERGGPTYTIDTVEALRDRGSSEIALILGADAVANLDSWHRAGDLAAMVSVAALPRWSVEGTRISSAPPSERWNVTQLSMPRLDIESTALRAACAAGAPLDGLVPAAVVHYIREHRLYTRT